MRNKLFFVLICCLTGVILGACQLIEDPNAQVTRVAATIFADQTAAALAATPTPTPMSTSSPTATATATSAPTLTPMPTATEIEDESQTADSLAPTEMPTPVPSPTPTTVSIPAARVVADTANLRSGPGTNYPAVGEIPQGDTLNITGRDTSTTWWQVVTADGQAAWVNSELVEVSNVADVPIATAPPAPTVAPEPVGGSGTLVTDSAADFGNPTQGWTYHWSQGRNNFKWEEMPKMPNGCFHSPNDMTLEICRDTITVDIQSRGDAALQWQAPQSGTYRFEWSANEVDGESSIWFYSHLNRVYNLEPGSELPYSATVEKVNQFHQFFFLPQYDTPYQVKVHKLQE
jgi:uncharacterized protein YraI